MIRRMRTIGRVADRAAAKPVPIFTGSFTPTLVGSGVAGTFTYTANATLVEWTRIGNRLYYNGRIVITATTVAPTLNMSINGWPYAGVASATMAIAGGGDLAIAGITLPANYLQTHLQFTTNATPSIIRSATAAAGLAIVQGAELAATMDIRFWGNYRVG